MKKVILKCKLTSRDKFEEKLSDIDNLKKRLKKLQDDLDDNEDELDETKKKLKNKVGIPGVRTGVVLWMIDHKKVFYIPTATFLQLQEDGKKSFNIKMENDEKYFSLLIPGVEKRMYIDSDYSVLKNLEDGQ